jgi:hypothetical protein
LSDGYTLNIIQWVVAILNGKLSLSLSARVGLISVFVSPALFVLGVFADSIRVETVQSNGLPRIEYPGGLFTVFALPASIWLMIFGIALLVTHSRPHRWSFLGSVLLASGILAVLIGNFLYSVTLSDEGPRCLGGCAPSLLRDYQETYMTCDSLVIAGFVAIGLGMFYLIRRKKGSAKSLLAEPGSAMPSV